MTGPEFKKWRILLGFRKRPALAEFIGVEVVTVTKWERGERRVPKYAIRALNRYNTEIIPISLSAVEGAEPSIS